MAGPETVSPWLTGVREQAPTLEGERSADVVIVGAGFSGLSTALALRREGLAVIVLEGRIAGFGASGRNAGHLTPTIGKDLPTLTRIYGRERIRGLVQLSETSIRHVEALIMQHGIDCDYEPVGNVVAAVHPSHYASLDRAAEAALRCGVAGRILEPKDMELRGMPRAFTRGFVEPHGGILNPGKYVRGLRSAALEAGAELYEQSPVVRIDETKPSVVHTASGKVRARYVVIATNAFTPELGLLRSSGLRLQVQLFQTEPLTAAQREALGWPGREGIYTAHEILESYRLTADQRIVGGSKAVRYGFAGRTLPDVDEAVSGLLESTFRKRFPEIHDVQISHHWGGPIFMSLDFLPVVGRRGKHGNVLHSIAYAGHGVAHASYAGEMIADLLLEREGPGAALWSRRSLPTPPEPLRWLTFHALNGFFSAMDRRVDRSIQAR
jgi:glycine/D-amino acid oxidase-like deaminating enzyme